MRPIAVLSLFLTMLLAVDSRAAWSRRYEELRSSEQTMLAALPDGRFLLGVAGTPSAVAILAADGSVQTARALDAMTVQGVSGSPQGDVYVTAADRADASGDSRLMKLHADLSLDWARRLVLDDGTPLRVYHVVATRDGGAAVVARVHAASVVVKVGTRGAVEWATRLDPTGTEQLNSIRQTRDGGFVLAGATPRQPWLIRLSTSGSVVWQRSYGPQGGLQSALQLPDGTFLALGSRAGVPLLVRTSSSGTLLRARIGTMAGRGEGHALAQADGHVVAELNLTSSGKYIVHLVSLRDDGTIEWQRAFARRDNQYVNPGFESARIGASGRQIAFAPPVSKPVEMFAIDAAAAPDGCAWLTDGTAEFTDAVLREESAAFEQGPVTVMAQNAPAVLTPLAPHATAAPCAAAAVAAVPPAAGPRGVAPSHVQAFRYPDDTEARKRDVELLLASKFEELDATAARLRRLPPSPDPIRPNGPLTTFYRAFTDELPAPEATRLERARAWFAARPRSTAARVALASVLYGAAWRARGNGLADEVSATGASTYRKFMEEMVPLLGSKELDSDPYAWYLRVAAAGEMGAGDDVRKLGLRALALHPDPDLARQVSRFLDPQWGGTPALYMQFAADAARVTAPALGDAMYMWLVQQIRNRNSSDDFKQYPVDWARVEKSAADLIRKNPQWPPSYHRYAFLAERYQKTETLRALMQRPELDWYEGAEALWGSREFYEIARRYVLPAEKVQPAPPSGSHSSVAAPPHAATRAFATRLARFRITHP